MSHLCAGPSVQVLQKVGATNVSHDYQLGRESEGEKQSQKTVRLSSICPSEAVPRRQSQKTVRQSDKRPGLPRIGAPLPIDAELPL